MSFVKSNGQVTSFARHQDVVDRDQRLFDSNEGLDEEVTTPLLKRATERLLAKIRSSGWWISSTKDKNRPAVDPNKILARQNDFTELCVYEALADYILPVIADFGSEDNAEKKKMEYYDKRRSDLFLELIEAGDWYDFDASGTVSIVDTHPVTVNLRRVR